MNLNISVKYGFCLGKIKRFVVPEFKMVAIEYREIKNNGRIPKCPSSDHPVGRFESYETSTRRGQSRNQGA